jgi:hypothetical protein
MEHFFGDYADSGDDVGSFASSLNDAVGNITAQDDALIAEYGHTADPVSDHPDTAQAPDALNSSDQAFLTTLDDASHGTLPDETNTWADNLNNEVNAMQDQTNAVIANAEHSPGFGETSPSAAQALNAFGTANAISASSYQDFESQLAQTDTDNAIQDSDSAMTDAEVAAATPDGSADD